MRRCNSADLGNRIAHSSNTRTTRTETFRRGFATFPSIIQRVGTSGAVSSLITASRYSSQGHRQRIPLAFGSCLAGGFFASCAGCSTVSAGSNEILELNYTAYGTGPKRAPGQGDIRVELRGSAKLYLQTGLIDFLYNVNIGLYLGQDRMDQWDQAGARIKITFKLYTEEGQLIAYFDNIYETQGTSKSLTRSLTPEILSRVARIEAAISYNY